MRKIITLVCLTVALAAQQFAQAHAMLDHASPAVGSTVATPPQEVVLWFTEQLEPAFSTIEVRGPGGMLVSTGRAQVGGDKTQMHVGLKQLAPGNYKVNWRALSVDTHRTQGSFSFHVAP
ncbi:MAG TPA: copper homeostasis periplasmic binding protein CopC [Pseudolabrys sp.]|nr:copper homeostasis periplasmic binding protein CopC [Pseudolabrys sp.]